MWDGYGGSKSCVELLEKNAEKISVGAEKREETAELLCGIAEVKAKCGTLGGKR